MTSPRTERPTLRRRPDVGSPTTTREPPAPPTPGTAHRRRRPHPAVVATLLATGVLTVILLTLGPMRGPRPPLDPEDPGPQGTRALAQVLASRGVRSEVLTSPRALSTSDVDADTTLVVTGPGRLTRSALDALEDTSPGRLVLVAPDRAVLDDLRVPASPIARAGTGPFPANCTGALAAPTDTLGGGALLYRATTPEVTTCFADPAEATDDPARPPSALLDVPASGTRPRTIVLGAPRALTNVGITQESHAALALRIVGGTDRVLWYQPAPDPADPPTPTGDGPPTPEWVAPVLLLLAAATFVLCLWRGRRLGPLTTEPLPVVVPAEETTLARARLYRRTGDTDGVADVLRSTAREDLRRTLRLPADADTPRIAAAAAARLGETDATPIRDLLTGPHTTRELARVARELHHLRRKVRRP